MKELTAEQTIELVEAVETVIHAPFMVIAVTEGGTVTVATNMPPDKFANFKLAVAALFSGLTTHDVAMTDLTEQRTKYRNEQNVPEPLRGSAEGDNPTPLV